VNGQPDSGFTRIPYVGSCVIEIAGETRLALICNLSLMGLYLQIDPVPTGELRLRFALPDGGPQIAAAATVTWVNEGATRAVASLPSGCGLRFVDVGPRDLHRISTLVAGYCATPSPLVGVSQPRSGAARVPLVAPCTISSESGVVQGSLCNLSAFGFYAAIDPAPPAGEVVTVTLELPGIATPFERRATPCWWNPNRPDRPHPLPPGCGFRFEDLTLADIRVLSRLVDDYLARLPTGAV
jgi:PilZ domain